MKYDYSKLNGKIVEVFGTQLKFAEAMGLSERTISLKLNNKIFWRQDEMQKAIKILGLRREDLLEYFLNNKYRTSEQQS